MKFTGLTCSGGHGLSLSVGQSTTDSSANTVSNIEFSDCTVTNSRNGITNYGVNVQEDYYNGGSSGTPKGNIPITGLVLKDIKGSMTGSSSMPVYILCGSNGCSNWKWSGISITGSKKANSCNYTPSGFSC
ncbi:hypothetical protein NQ314_001201 [Rhamnusium bicolor]|uniref:Uncharacterized protein n=1 Tax=Rhamnusium bicolor TaxID=1586634 RepID=A0AAV8ZU77_9CUCU|nr:hypothetical protein NQ314_001201 [Rhamnusium bicolor]